MNMNESKKRVTEKQKSIKIFTGVVVSTKMDKTATVVVDRIVMHKKYKKRYKRSKKYQVHDELGVQVEDRVKFIASKPYSKLKKWIIVEVIKNVSVKINKKPKAAKTNKKQ